MLMLPLIVCSSFALCVFCFRHHNWVSKTHAHSRLEYLLLATRSPGQAGSLPGLTSSVELFGSLCRIALRTAEIAPGLGFFVQGSIVVRALQREVATHVCVPELFTVLARIQH